MLCPKRMRVSKSHVCHEGKIDQIAIPLFTNRTKNVLPVTPPSTPEPRTAHLAMYPRLTSHISIWSPMSPFVVGGVLAPGIRELAPREPEGKGTTPVLGVNGSGGEAGSRELLFVLNSELDTTASSHP